jgi:hypothetical protein
VIALEAVAMVIVAVYVAARYRLAAEPRRFLVRLALLSVASWIAEETAIRAYRFYAYSPDWTVFVGHVPLAVILIWPGVIHSAWDTTRYLLRLAQPEPAAADGAPPPIAAPRAIGVVALVAGLFVLADASLIEPVSVQARLWHWNEPGLFAVPPIGVLGWAFHAFWCIAVFESNGRARRSTAADGLILLVSPLGTHGLLLMTWWGALRWVNETIPPWPVVVVAWCLAVVLAARAWRARVRDRIPPPEMWTRVPAALFFFALLLLHGREVPALWAYAFAFAPPYIALTRARGALQGFIGPPRAARGHPAR